MTVTTTNQARHTITPTNSARNSATLLTTLKAGSSAKYNQPGFTYNQVSDPQSGNLVYYNTVGVGLTVTNQTKS